MSPYVERRAVLETRQIVHRLCERLQLGHQVEVVASKTLQVIAPRVKYVQYRPVALALIYYAIRELRRDIDLQTIFDRLNEYEETWDKSRFMRGHDNNHVLFVGRDTITYGMWHPRLRYVCVYKFKVFQWYNRIAGMVGRESPIEYELIVDKLLRKTVAELGLDRETTSLASKYMQIYLAKMAGQKKPRHLRGPVAAALAMALAKLKIPFTQWKLARNLDVSENVVRNNQGTMRQLLGVPNAVRNKKLLKRSSIRIKPHRVKVKSKIDTDALLQGHYPFSWELHYDRGKAYRSLRPGLGSKWFRVPKLDARSNQGGQEARKNNSRLSTT